MPTLYDMSSDAAVTALATEIAGAIKDQTKPIEHEACLAKFVEALRKEVRLIYVPPAKD